MNRSGYFLIESLMYCVVLALLCSLLFSYSVQINKSLTAINTITHDYATLLAAHDVCIRDIQCGISDADKWYEGEDNMVIWSVGDEARCWWSTLTKIERIAGKFDFIHHRWSKSTKGLVAQIDEAEVMIEPLADELKKTIRIVDVAFFGESKNHTIAIESKVAPRNRIV
jgi:hypothetical protein